MSRSNLLLPVVLAMSLMTCMTGSARAGSPPAAGPDFDNDGFGDLAVPVSGQTVSGQAGAGAVHVFYGSANGLNGDRDEVWTEDSTGLANLAEAGDGFGDALAWGDFNGDGFDDLAIGAPNEDDEVNSDSGMVCVLYGSANGLRGMGSLFIDQGLPGIAGEQQGGGQFGRALAGGDFNGDGRADLAIGAPGRTVGGAANAGAVNVLFGSANGLKTSASQYWTQNSNGILDDAEENDSFGVALAAGDFNGDGKDDLAIGAFSEDVGPIDRAGAVNVLYGGVNGLKAADNQFWHQDLPNMLGTSSPNDAYGHTLAAGDFNGDGRFDLAVGVWADDFGAVLAGGIIADAGGVYVIYGSDAGLTSEGNQMWSQESAGIADTAEEGDRFGWYLAAGHFGSDDKWDLAVGASRQMIDGVEAAGAVHIILGSAGGLTSAGSQFWSLDSPGIAQNPGVNDQFGNTMFAGDFNGNGRDDLAVAAPHKTVGLQFEAGVVSVLYAGGSGLRSNGSQVLHENRTGVNGSAQANDRFGGVLATF